MFEPIYITPHSLLVFTYERVLKRIKCPFKVQAIKADAEISESGIYFVHRVYPSAQHRLLYEINGIQYPYNTFQIILQEDQLI